MRIQASSVLAFLAPSLAAFSSPFAPARPTASPFAASTLSAHPTGLLDDQCAATDAPILLEIAAPPRALPKRKGSGGEGEGPLGEDPLGLWTPPTSPGGPKGPSVFKLNQGRAIDMLRGDYPRLFTDKPDLSIFTSEVELHDPTGRRLRGLKQYGKIFDALRFLRRTTMQDAQVTYRLVVVDDRIRVRWTAKLWMRDPALGLTTMANGEPAVVHLDGVSNYHLDAEGKIFRHTLENIILNGPDAAEPVQLALAWPKMPLAASPELAMPMPFFRPLDAAANWAPPKALAQLFEPAVAAAAQPAAGAPPQPTQPASQPSPQPLRKQQQLQLQALHLAAQPAKRRGGAPQASASDGPPADETPMQRAARERAEDAAKARSLAELRAPKADPRKSLFGRALPQPCDTSYDCERPDVCCDLLFGSVCCNAGMMIPTTDGRGQPVLQRQAIPIPVEKDDGLPRMPPPQQGPEW